MRVKHLFIFSAILLGHLASAHDTTARMEPTKLIVKFGRTMKADEIKQQMPAGLSLNYLSEDGRTAMICAKPGIHQPQQMMQSKFNCNFVSDKKPALSCAKNGDITSINAETMPSVGGLKAVSDMLVKQDPKPTFARDVAPILRQNCINCHRENGVGKGSLVTYHEAKSRADEVRDVVDWNQMPQGASWIPSDDCGGKDRFSGPRFLTDAEKKLISDWRDQSDPAFGDPMDLACPP